jgi:hypothetical protein
MEVLQTILVEQLGQIPRLLAKEFFADKLRDAGVPYTDNLLEKLTDHCISGNQEVFRWDDDGDESADVELTISNADLAAFDRRASKFFEQLPDIIEGVATKSAATIVRNLRKNWAGEHKLQKIEISEFRLHLEKYWDEPLNLLRMIVTIAREIVSEQAVRKRRSKRYKALPDALLRLNVRACQITSEVITLLENGFADGAMARWRTLYEVSVVAMVIAEGGETLAKRYVDHQYVEAKGGNYTFDVGRR